MNKKHTGGSGMSKAGAVLEEVKKAVVGKDEVCLLYTSDAADE